MMSPFDRKNKLASWLDRLALRALLLVLCIGYFFWLWRNGPASLLGGGALFLLLVLALMLFERRTLQQRDRMLRERIGGTIAIEELIMLPGGAACRRVRDLLCEVLCAEPREEDLMRYGGETWLIRCAQCLQGASTSAGDVLSAHRARIECGADKTALVSTGTFSPEATRAAEWADPPVRLISGRQLSLLFGRMHPATDEEIAHHAQRRRKPFSRQRILALALSPAKLPRYLLCALLLTLWYFFFGSVFALLAGLLSFTLAVLCSRENRRSFSL